MIKRAIQFVLLLCIAAPLGGCGGDEPHVVTQIQTVDRPVATSCVPAGTPAAPTYPDGDDALKAAPDAAQRYLLLYAGRKLRVARSKLTESILQGCR